MKFVKPESGDLPIVTMLFDTHEDEEVLEMKFVVQNKFIFVCMHIHNYTHRVQTSLM